MPSELAKEIAAEIMAGARAESAQSAEARKQATIRNKLLSGEYPSEMALAGLAAQHDVAVDQAAGLSEADRVVVNVWQEKARFHGMHWERSAVIERLKREGRITR